MRFHFDDARRHRRVTKVLPRMMREAGIDIGHTAAADVAARLFGYADRHELDACLGRTPASRWDEDEAPAVVAARRSRQVSALVGAGLTQDSAGHLLDGLRPTALARPGGPRPAALSSPRPAVKAKAAAGLDAILDAWDNYGADEIPEIFARHVRDAYDAGFDRLSLFVNNDSTYHVVGFHYEGQSTLAKGPAHVGGRIIEWIGRPGSIHDIAHGDILVPYEVKDVQGTRFTGALRVNKRAPAPMIGDYGIERHRDWLNALRSRPGLHLICCPKGFELYMRKGYGRLEESLSIALEAYSVHVLSNLSAGTAKTFCRNHDLEGPPQATRISTRASRPKYLMVIPEEPDVLPELREIVDSGSSVLLQVRGTLDEAVDRLLVGGVPSTWLRSNILSLSVRTDTPDPHSPMSKIGMDEFSSMTWSVEIRHPKDVVG